MTSSDISNILILVYINAIGSMFTLTGHPDVKQLIPGNPDAREVWMLKLKTFSAVFKIN